MQLNLYAAHDDFPDGNLALMFCLQVECHYMHLRKSALCWRKEKR